MLFLSSYVSELTSISVHLLFSKDFHDGRPKGLAEQPQQLLLCYIWRCVSLDRMEIVSPI